MILSDYLEKKLLDMFLCNTAYTAPTNLYFGLFTADPGESGVTGEYPIGTGAYARAVVANNSTNFPLCSMVVVPVKTNGTIIAWPTATTAWGTATHWAVFDASTGATNMLAHGPLTAPWTVASGSTPKIVAGSFSLSASNAAGGGTTNFAQRKALDLVFGAVPYTSPSTVFVGLGTALSGETITEWADTAALRPAVTFDAATLGAGTSSNSAILAIATTATAATLTHYGIWDATTAGNLLFVGPLESSRTVSSPDTVNLATITSIVVTLQ